MLRFLSILVLISFGVHTKAETKFYQCKDKWGQPVFSQRPCGSDAEKASVTAHARISEETSTTTLSSDREPLEANVDESPVKEKVTSWDRVRASNRIRDIDRDVYRRESHIDTWEAERDNRIAVLRNARRRANNNLAGATWQESLASEMEAVAQQYDSKIDREQIKINRLLEEKSELKEFL